MPTFEQLEAEALAAPVSGWDFSWLRSRSSTEPLPWSYRKVVDGHARSTTSMLDMGTGGGEILARFRSRPPRTVATEAWPPNVPVAAARLRSLGVPVVQDEGARNNDQQRDDDARGRLPFRDGAFDLVTNRHESFRAAEVSRILAPGGVFVTQQVDHSTYDLYRLLDLEAGAGQDSWLPLARQQVTVAGLNVLTAVAGEEVEHFDDVAAIIYYLRLVSWALPDYSLDMYRERLRAAWADSGRWPATIRQNRFLLVAAKP